MLSVRFNQYKEHKKMNTVTLKNLRKDGNWTIGNAECEGMEYKFNVKHFDDPSDYGIKDGRISKLWLAPANGNFRYTILLYDRKWERGCTTRGKGNAVKAVYNELLKRFN